MEGTNALMRHERTGVILSTGGHAMVKAAYSSGKPAFGVGPGNVPVLVDTSADLEDAIAKIVAGKSFDYGTVCSSEQAIVAEYIAARPHHGAAETAQGLLLQRPAEGGARQTAAHAELDRESAMRGAGAHQDRADGGLRSSGRYVHHLLRNRRRRQAASALGREAFAGALAVFCAGLRHGAGHLFRPAEIRRRRPHRCHLLQERYAHPRVRACACRPSACW